MQVKPSSAIESVQVVADADCLTSRAGTALRTSAPGVFAIGDVLGRVQHTHFATYTAGIAVANRSSVRKGSRSSM